MKKTKKLIVGGLIGMLGIVAATTATSGVAWFTTTRTAAVSITNLVATAAEGNLTIANGGYTEEGLTQTINSGANSSTIAATAQLTDVSSCDGVNFFKVSTANDVSTSRQETGKVNSINNTLYNYYAWDLTITNTAGANSPMDVYLSKAGNIFTDGDGEDDYHPENWYRLAIFDTTVASANCVFLYNQETTDSNHAYGINAAGTVAVGTPRTAAFSHASTCVQYDVDPGLNGASTVTNQLLIEDLGTASKTLIFVIWCEGLLTPANGTGLLVTGAFNLIGFNHAAS